MTRRGAGPREAIGSPTNSTFKAKTRKTFGYSFFSKQQSIQTMYERLQKVTDWPWSLRVNDTYGDYLLSRPMPDVRVRIFSLPSSHYHLDVICAGDAAAAWEQLNKHVYELLPKIEASDVAKADYFD